MAGVQPADVRQRRIDHISALAADIAVQEHIAVKLVKTTVRAFYDFFTIACLTVGVVALAIGKHDKAVLWGGTGLILAGIWLIVYVGSKLSKRAWRELRAEMRKPLPGHQPAADRRPAADRQSTAGQSHPS